MRKLKNKRGFTLAELLIVVAIIVILAGVAFVSVHNYQRSLGQIERDGIAREIFVAAQNHLSVAYGEGYPGVASWGELEEGDNQIYHVIVNGSIPDDSIVAKMLPFGSIDETIRVGGSYIIRYQKSSGLVLDVFYCSNSVRNSYDFKLEDYSVVKDYSGNEKKEQRKTFNEGKILGWYGGVDAAQRQALVLEPPSIEVFNEEELYVKVTNPNTNPTTWGQMELKLIVTGLRSNAKKAIKLKGVSSPRVKSGLDGKSEFIVILDDITKGYGVSGLHFCNLGADTTEEFLPGEDVEIQAVACSTSVFSNVAYSSKNITNSLFEGIVEDIINHKATAYIGNIRHLENLDTAISKLDTSNIYEYYAEQTDSFSWNTFLDNVHIIDGSNSERVYTYIQTAFEEKPYIPIKPDYALKYDGKNHSISDVVVTNAKDAGIFGKTTKVSEIKNLELLDFSISSNDSAGALAGTLSGTTITNVIARVTEGKDPTTLIVKASISGGLVGDLNGDISYCAAAMIVGGNTTTAGGLLGECSGTITGCYSGGHTKNASYSEWVDVKPYDVKGSTAGGLVGSYTGTGISYSYSTCSVYGTTIAGGFAGTASGGSINDSYSTGLVKSDGTKFAFLGSGSANLSGNHYYSIINEVEKNDTNWDKVYELLLPYDGYNPESSSDLNKAKAIDYDLETYSNFVGNSWFAAKAYDPKLVLYYNAKYDLKNVRQLCGVSTGEDALWAKRFVSVHYGDWPAPELLTINE